MNLRKLITKGIRYLTDEDFRFNVNRSRFSMYHNMPDEEYLKRIFHYYMGYELNLNNPKTFNEKLQWLKLYDRRPEYISMVDKYKVKAYVAERIGEQFVIPTLGIWNNFEEIDFDELPSQFVLKCTHDSGGVTICKDKALWDKQKAKTKLEKSLKRNYYYKYREWPYKNVKPRILAEKYMEDELTHELRDYKFFTFNGIAKALFIASDRQVAGEDTKFDFFDMDFNHLPLTNGHPNATTIPSKPKTFEKMREFAEKLSEGIPHVRVDFYEANGTLYFGEFTFTHWAGMVPFEPKEWDRVFGDWINLPK